LFDNGDGTFRPGVNTLTVVGAGQCIAVDTNGDGKIDLVQPGSIEGNDANLYGIGVSLGNGDGTFRTPQAFAEPEKPGAISTGIFTKGGHPGIAVCCAPNSGDLVLYHGNGAGGFSAPHYFNLPGGGRLLASAPAPGRPAM
jgi:hypothetical protein